MKSAAVACVLLVTVHCSSPNQTGSGDGGPGQGGGEEIDAASSGGGGASPDAAPVVKECPETPSRSSSSPPTSSTSACSWMDWNLSEDGFYILTEFGTSADQDNAGLNNSCGALQTHYAGNCCLFDADTMSCLDVDETGQLKERRFLAERGNGPDQCRPQDIPETGPPEVIEATRTSNYWYAARKIDWDYWSVINEVMSYYEDEDGNLLPPTETSDFPHPEYFYTAGAQRFGCGTYLRISNPANGRCVVAYADDGGPGASIEGVEYAGRRIIDTSPAIARLLRTEGSGWLSGSLLYVEWAQPGDYPGDQCTPCQSLAAKVGTEEWRSPFDLTQGFRDTALCRTDNAGIGHGVHGGTDVQLPP